MNSKSNNVKRAFSTYALSFILVLFTESILSLVSSQATCKHIFSDSASPTIVQINIVS